MYCFIWIDNAEGTTTQDKNTSVKFFFYSSVLTLPYEEDGMVDRKAVSLFLLFYMVLNVFSAPYSSVASLFSEEFRNILRFGFTIQVLFFLASELNFSSNLFPYSPYPPASETVRPVLLWHSCNGHLPGQCEVRQSSLYLHQRVFQCIHWRTADQDGCWHFSVV